MLLPGDITLASNALSNEEFRTPTVAMGTAMPQACANCNLHKAQNVGRPPHR